MLLAAAPPFVCRMPHAAHALCHLLGKRNLICFGLHFLFATNDLLYAICLKFLFKQQYAGLRLRLRLEKCRLGEILRLGSYSFSVSPDGFTFGLLQKTLGKLICCRRRSRSWAWSVLTSREHPLTPLTASCSPLIFSFRSFAVLNWFRVRVPRSFFAEFFSCTLANCNWMRLLLTAPGAESFKI